MHDIETRHFESGNDFIAALRRSDPYWLPQDHWVNPWIFRGQASADWKLIPSAWRETAQSHELYAEVERLDWDEVVADVRSDHQNSGLNVILEQPKTTPLLRRLVIQHRFEFVAARAFADLVNDLGLPLPGGHLPRMGRYDPLRWIDETAPFHPTIALAQHHGMPTRLLDWSHNPLYAAFFATEGVSPGDEGEIVVWALNRATAVESECREFTVPRSQIGYLHAQEGLFTYLQTADHKFLVSGQWPSFESLIPSASLRRLTLPKREVPTLKRLLFAERVSKAHLMPTLDNVTHALRSIWNCAR